jgi:hypothetical protein
MINILRTFMLDNLRRYLAFSSVLGYTDNRANSCAAARVFLPTFFDTESLEMSDIGAACGCPGNAAELGWSDC